MDSANFVQTALSDLKQAEQVLADYPAGLPGADFYSALVTGDTERLKPLEIFTGRKGGPRDWEPLLYVCFSRFADPRSHRAGKLLEAARMLLSRGADPNASWVDPRWPDSPLPCLYGATGLNNNPALALLLLEAGADPNDGESLYHSTEHPDLECMRLLLKHGASPRGKNAVNHILDREDLIGLRLLLDAGADPNEPNYRGETSLHWAVWRGRSLEALRLLIEARAAIDATGKGGRTAYELAVLTGQQEAAKLLEARGASLAVRPIDDRDASLLPEMAANHLTSAVQSLLAAGLPVDARGTFGATALHQACWNGYADIVKLLLEHGASLTVKDHVYGATPQGWFEHGLQNCGVAKHEFPEVERLLRNAGADFPQT